MTIHHRVGRTISACGLVGDSHLTSELANVTCHNCLRGTPRKLSVPNSGLGIIRCSICGDPLRDHQLFDHIAYAAHARDSFNGQELNHGV